jgi:hypothetical protein
MLPQQKEFKMKTQIFLAVSLTVNVVLLCATTYSLGLLLHLPPRTEPAIFFAARSKGEIPAKPATSAARLPQ